MTRFTYHGPSFLGRLEEVGPAVLASRTPLEEKKGSRAVFVPTLSGGCLEMDRKMTAAANHIPDGSRFVAVGSRIIFADGGQGGRCQRHPGGGKLCSAPVFREALGTKRNLTPGQVIRRTPPIPSSFMGDLEARSPLQAASCKA